jgi:hypothetical protein
MIVTPSPVCLLIFVPELGERLVLAMILLYPHTVRPIFTAVPFVVVVVPFVVVYAILGSGRWGHCDRRDEGGAQ